MSLVLADSPRVLSVAYTAALVKWGKDHPETLKCARLYAEAMIREGHWRAEEVNQ